MTVIIDGTNGVTFPDNSTQAKTGANATNITAGVLLQSYGGSNVTSIPAFRAGRASNQSVSSATNTKVQYDNEFFDTNNNYDTTNYRFTPTVAGYYQINATAQLIATSGTVFLIVIYKNGAAYQRCSSFYGSANEFGSAGSALVYCNGSTDYIEVYTYILGTSPYVFGDLTISTFSGCLIRGA
jgi:hypothetical protein